jgi:hypothetical protein
VSSNPKGFKTEQVGSDPFTIWVSLTGSAVTLSLKTAIVM